MARLVRSALVLVAVAASTHFLLAALPGDAIDARSGTVATTVDRLDARAAVGLDEPATERFVTWLGKAVRGDLGTSQLNGLPVARSIVDRLPVTLELVVCSQLVAVGAALLVALAGARRPGHLVDRVAPIVSLTAMSIPTYLTAVVLLSVFSVRLGWFPVTDFVTLGGGSVPRHVRSMVLPVAALAIPEVAWYHRAIRTSLATTVRQPYVTAAIGRGLSARRVLLRHALPAASVAPLALLAPAVARSIGGTVLVEHVFSIPGLGRYALDAINGRDQPAIVACVVVAAGVYLATAAATDHAGRRLDPRSPA